MSINQIIELAIDKKYKLEIEYVKYDSEKSIRTISNLEYCNEFGSFGYHNDHIRAYCHLRDENRTFKISRISKAKIVSTNVNNENEVKRTPSTSVVIPTAKTNTTIVNNSKPSEGCYIATMVYGNYDDDNVLILRHYRDNTLSKYTLGRKFIKVYYYLSPMFVSKLKNNKTINSIIKSCLDIFIKFVK